MAEEEILTQLRRESDNVSKMNCFPMRCKPSRSFICSSVITWGSHAPVRTVGYARCFTVDIPVPRANRSVTAAPIAMETSIQRRPSARQQKVETPPNTYIPASIWASHAPARTMGLARCFTKAKTPMRIYQKSSKQRRPAARHQSTDSQSTEMQPVYSSVTPA